MKVRILKAVISILEACEMFYQFLKQEYCEENLLFITEVYEYKNIINVEKRRRKADQIFTKYIKQKANSEVCTFNKNFMQIYLSFYQPKV